MRYKAWCFFLLLLTGAGASRAQETRHDSIIVHFAYNDARILPGDEARLHMAFRDTSRHLIRIGLQGHCDSIGGHRYNDSLSQVRVDAVHAWLIHQGFSENLFQATHAYGKRLPLTGNDSDSSRALNRRVVVEYEYEYSIPPQTVTVSPKEKPEPTLKQKILDTATHIGTHIILRNVVFYPSRHTPMEEAEAPLQELLKVMQDIPTLRIVLEGHICCSPPGRDAYDIDNREFHLSVERAKYVYQFLRSHGIEPVRMIYQGFGSSRKIYPEERNEREKKENRRVEIKIVAL